MNAPLLTPHGPEPAHVRAPSSGAADDRALQRAQLFRHLVHLVPGGRVLVCGRPDPEFLHRLLAVSRGRCSVVLAPIQAAAGDGGGRSAREPVLPSASALPAGVELLLPTSDRAEMQRRLGGRRFDRIVGIDALVGGEPAGALRTLFELLEPGGDLVLFESNPWRPLRWARRTLPARADLYALLSALGFVNVLSFYGDFCYLPGPAPLRWLQRNLSTLLENAPGVQRFARSLVIHARRPATGRRARRRPSLARHPELRGQISVVVPCHNEEMNVRPLVERLRELYDDYLHEVILVDDNSQDRTREVIRELAAADPRVVPVFRSPPNGVGRALADGYRVARGRWVLSMDCDFQHLLSEVEDLFDAAVQGYDVVVGSRFNRHAVLLNYPFMKIVANRGFHLLAQVLLLRRFRDLTNNLKLIRRDVLQGMRLVQPGFAVNAETGLQPLVLGCAVREVPVSWVNRTPDMGSSSFRLARVGGGYGRVLWDLLRRELFRHGPYRDLERAGHLRSTWRGAGVAEAERAEVDAARRVA